MVSYTSAPLSCKSVGLCARIAADRTGGGSLPFEVGRCVVLRGVVPGKFSVLNWVYLQRFYSFFVPYVCMRIHVCTVLARTFSCVTYSHSSTRTKTTGRKISEGPAGEAARAPDCSLNWLKKKTSALLTTTLSPTTNFPWDLGSTWGQESLLELQLGS